MKYLVKAQLIHMKEFLSKRAKQILKVLGYLFILGGIVRIFSNKELFELFWMDQLWADHPYFIYVYRVLGAFVLFTGLSFVGVSGNIRENRKLIRAWSIAFIILGIVMLVTGLMVQLPIVFYIFDFAFCFAVAIFLSMILSAETGK